MPESIEASFLPRCWVCKKFAVTPYGKGAWCFYCLVLYLRDGLQLVNENLTDIRVSGDGQNLVHYLQNTNGWLYNYLMYISLTELKALYSRPI